ncbi:MAG: glutaredoxin family protein [Pelotomaculum sp.]|jgi:glutaredoxin 3
MKDVVMYTSPTCHYCHAAKDYFAKNNIPYVEKDISSDSQARAELLQLKARGVPTFVIGDEVIVGFDQKRLMELIEQNR